MIKQAKAYLIQSDTLKGLLLIVASLIALLLANSSLAPLYEKLIKAYLSIGINDFALSKPILLWINDGLMALFFLLIGLEIKREILEGELSKLSQILLPGAAALGGIIVPGLIYYAFNHNNNLTITGWAIPTATDIAFALGVLALLGSRIPHPLKIFLLTVAIFDDLAAIIIIAVFYTDHLSTLSLVLALLAILALMLCNYLKVTHLPLYFLIGFCLWLFVLKSGVHATLAGVVLGLAIPHKTQQGKASPLHIVENSLSLWVNYFILPLFAFANAGISFSKITLEGFFSPLTMGITLGLFLGKQIGIFTTAFLLIKLNIAKLPSQTNWKQFYGVAVLCGIGFTMSLFISSLALEGAHADYSTLSRLGIFMGSLMSALVGYTILRWGSK